MNEEEVLVGRIQDLAEQCYHRDVPSHTEFLTLAEQDLFYRTVNKIPGVRYVLSGGYEAAERKAALFLPSYAEDGDASMLPIAVVRISPLNEKFADALSHRDFLGSLMNLGVERYKLGDILIDGNQAYLICMADMADYICAELKKVRHTPPMYQLDAAQRRANVLGAFAAGPEELHGLSVLLVDDIFTTGATFSECARVLREQGASHVYGAALAQTPRRPERNKQRTS